MTTRVDRKNFLFNFNYLGVGKVANHYSKQMRKITMPCDEIFICHQHIEYSCSGPVLTKVQR